MATDAQLNKILDEVSRRTLGGKMLWSRSGLATDAYSTTLGDYILHISQPGFMSGVHLQVKHRDGRTIANLGSEAGGLIQAFGGAKTSPQIATKVTEIWNYVSENDRDIKALLNLLSPE